jgi:hypothetical protein
MFHRLPVASRAIAHEIELGGWSLRGPSFETPTFGGLLQDEVRFHGEILAPHGEERGLRRVSNHEARLVTHSLHPGYRSAPQPLLSPALSRASGSSRSIR